MFTPSLQAAVRDRFMHTDRCPFTGERVFFENAGGALTLASVVERASELLGVPDNQGRDNPASHALVSIIEQGRADMRAFLGCGSGPVFIGESGTELLFRLVRTACLGSPAGGDVVGTTLEHPATASARRRWAAVAGKRLVNVPHNDATGGVTVDDYAKYVTADTRVATIIQASPVTGIGVDVAAIAGLIRERSPDCFIVIDGIQHAAHGHVDIDGYAIDGYVISPYKVFSRHNYGIAWASDRLSDLPHDQLYGTPPSQWELGTRDTSAYACWSEVAAYLDWLGQQVGEDRGTRRENIGQAADAIATHEQALTGAMLHGTGNLPGLADMEAVTVIGGVDNPHREGLVCLTVDGVAAADVVTRLNDAGIRTHTRKADHYSANVLSPLGLDAAVRVSMCHYNTADEVARFLDVMRPIAGAA
ncbi:MAG: aminotransferase class V-fold PLP-dependent enzyme [Pseudomonadota bacterium]